MKITGRFNKRMFYLSSFIFLIEDLYLFIGTPNESFQLKMYKYAKRLCDFVVHEFIFAHPTTYKSGKVLWYIKIILYQRFKIELQH